MTFFSEIKKEFIASSARVRLVQGLENYRQILSTSTVVLTGQTASAFCAYSRLSVFIFWYFETLKECGTNSALQRKKNEVGRSFHTPHMEG